MALSWTLACENDGVLSIGMGAKAPLFARQKG